MITPWQHHVQLSLNQEQDTDMVLHISDLPEELRIRTAACVEQGSLPALRLVSRTWCEAANLAKRQLKLDFPTLDPPQAQKSRLIGQKWPNLERLDLVLDELALPDRRSRDLILALRPLMQLRDLYLVIGALLLPEGQEFILRQTRLLSLCTISLWAGDGATDGLLQVVGRLSHLTRLEIDLYAKGCTGKYPPGMLAPPQQQPATDEGLQCLSSLQSLKDLRMTVQDTFTICFTGRALSTVGSLHQLTHLSLWGWPIVDTDLGHLTLLQLMSLDLESCSYLTSGCLMHISLITSLRSLNLVGSGDWQYPEEALEAFEELAIEKLPFLTILNHVFTCT